jgi:hypothetical protein
MGQAKRRKLEIEVLKQIPRASVEAIHEAGHALGRFLTAEDMGVPVEQAIDHIAMHAPGAVQMGDSHDGSRSLSSRGVTYGRMFSKEIEQAAEPVIERYRKGQMPKARLRREVIAAARLAGADIERWLRARAIIMVAGPMPEAKHTRRRFEQVWNGYEAESDRADFELDADAADVTAAKRAELLQAAQSYLRTVIDDRAVRDAVRLLASRLPKSGRMEGREVAAILAAALQR